ncbi:hypothetical protein T492DRAFT_1047466 [Pavlovales sp. CCMP2436]|nr:hypothetical protein T492DRAFT_1047466 [Pavlovales sp. CCMP2436]
MAAKQAPPYLVEAEVDTAVAQGAPCCFMEAKFASKRPPPDASHHANIVTEVHVVTDVSVVEAGGSPHVVTDVSVVEAGGSPSMFAVSIAPTPRCGTIAAAPTLALAPAPFTAARETAVNESYLAVNGGYLDVGISGVALRDAEIVFSALLRENLCRSESSTALKHVAAAIAAARGMTHTVAASTYGVEERQVSRWVAKLRELHEKRPGLLRNELSASAVPSAALPRRARSDARIPSAKRKHENIREVIS